MKTRKDPRVYLFHIRDALDCISRYTVEGKRHFLRDDKTQDAVIFNLAIIGEAVKNLPRDVRSRYSSTPWKNIAGLRDIVIHEYDTTEIPRIWKIVQNDVPRLRETIDLML